LESFGFLWVTSELGQVSGHFGWGCPGLGANCKREIFDSSFIGNRQ